MRQTDLRTRAHALASDRRGNVAVIFAFALLPIAMAAGGAVDLRRQATSQEYLQDSVDSAVLSAAKSYYGASGLSQAQRLAAAQTSVDRFMAASTRARAETILTPSWTLAYNPAKGEFTVDALARSPAAFGGLFGMSTLRLATSGSAASGERRVEVALVLDSTGSMAGSKMANLKTASTKFVDVMMAAAATHPKPDAVKISLVPYSNTVKVGAQYATAPWMDLGGIASTHYENVSLVTAGQPLQPVLPGAGVPTRFGAFALLKTGWGGCIESRPMPYDVNGAAPTAATPDTLYVPYFAPDEPDRYDASGAVGPFNINQSVNDYLSDGPFPADAAKDWFKRQQNALKYVNPVPTTTPRRTVFGTDFGPNRDCVVAPLIRLTTDGAAIKTGIAGLKAEGNTNIMMGLAWGWNTIAPQAPFSDGRAYDADQSTKIIILMTDGDNTYAETPGRVDNVTYTKNPNNSVYAGLGYIVKKRLGISNGNGNQLTKAMDDRMTAMCNAIKGAGITANNPNRVVIYTVRVEVKGGNNNTLKNCASSPDHFRDVQDASQLDAVFEEIAKSILQIRISN